jgi:transcriptional regulator with XRE-family HTH domain
MTWRSTILVAISAPIVEKFRAYLRQEFIRRKNKNPKYSLRAFAQQLKINHATLSTILAGKRKITKRTFLALSKRLALNAKEVSRFMADDPSFKGHKSSPYFALQQDVFSLIADWHFDAILELSQIKKLKLDPKEISRVLGIPVAVAKQSLQTLERLETRPEDIKSSTPTSPTSSTRKRLRSRRKNTKDPISKNPSRSSKAFLVRSETTPRPLSRSTLATSVGSKSSSKTSGGN